MVHRFLRIRSFVLVAWFDLDPGPRSPAREITAGEPLGHDALKLLTDYLIEKRSSWPDDTTWGEQLLIAGPAQAAQVSLDQFIVPRILTELS